MHSTFSQTQPTTQSNIPGKLQNFWYRGRTPRWQPENFTVSNEILQNKDTFINQAEQVFNQYDRDRSGNLDKKEFKRAIQALGYDKIKSKMVGRLVDKDVNNRISIDEFVNIFLFLKSGGQVQNIPGSKGNISGGIQQQQLGTTGFGTQPQTFGTGTTGVGQQSYGQSGVGSTLSGQQGYGQSGLGQQSYGSTGTTGLGQQSYGTTGLGSSLSGQTGSTFGTQQPLQSGIGSTVPSSTTTTQRTTTTGQIPTSNIPQQGTQFNQQYQK